MTKTQSNKLSMLEVVVALLKLSIDKLSVIPILIALANELIALVTEIKETDQNVKTLSAGKTSAKDEAKDDLIDVLLPLANSLFVYAKRSKNEELKAMSNVTKTVLVKLRENDLVIKALAIKDALTANAALLADYLITPEKITNLANSITDFQNAADTKDTGFVNRVAAREKLDKLFDDADDLLLDQLDGMMEVFKNTDTDFYNAYFAARVIKDLGTRKVIKETPAPANPA